MGDDISVKVPDRPLVVLGAIAAIVPFFGSSVTSSSVTANGRVTEFSYRDNVALAGGGVAAVCGLIALLLVFKHKGGAARIGAAVVVLALGGIHIARGLGVFDRPAGASSHVSTDVEPTAPPPTVDAPAPCASAKACYEAAMSTKDAATALTAFARACELGSGDGCYEAGAICVDKIETPDLRKAAAFYKKGCALDHADSCDSLGNAYTKGAGVEKDEANGTALYEKACDFGLALGCTNLGIAYVHGYADVAPDPDKAIAPLTKACDKDSPSGCDELGFVYLKSKTTAVKAGPLFEKACKLDDNHCVNLAIGLDHADRGLKRDLKRAIALYTAGCDKGTAPACNNLGTHYRDGDGVPKDLTKAKQLFQKACDAGSKNGCENLK